MAKSHQTPRPARTRTPARRRLVTRLWHAAERQVSEIEARLAAGGDPAALERDAKTFALIARTVRELVALDAEAAAQEKHRPHAAPENAAEDSVQRGQYGARDIEDFRAELARRLAQISAQGDAEHAS